MSSIPGMVAPGDLGRMEGLGAAFVHLDQIVWAGFVGADTGTQQSALEMRRSGGRWHVGPPQGYASSRRILLEDPRTFERDHSPLRSGVWCRWSGCGPILQGTEVSGVRGDPGWVLGLCLWWWGTSPGPWWSWLVPRSHPRGHTGPELCQPLGNPLPQWLPLSWLQFGFASPSGWRQGAHGMSGRVRGCEPPRGTGCECLPCPALPQGYSAG